MNISVLYFLISISYFIFKLNSQLKIHPTYLLVRLEFLYLLMSIDLIIVNSSRALVFFWVQTRPVTLKNHSIKELVGTMFNKIEDNSKRFLSFF